jgi:hypothetical protein
LNAASPSARPRGGVRRTIAGLAIPALVALPVFAATPPGGTAAVTDSVCFDSESITLTVTDSTAQVSGWYRFRNLSPRSLRVSVVYPFPVDALHRYPHSVRIYAVLATDTVRVEPRKLEDLASVWLLVPLQPDTITTWHVEYEQLIEASCARYVLTSTAAWGRPLRAASYEVVHPSGFLEVEVWPRPDSVTTASGWTTRKCSRANFLPRDDLWIRWRDPSRPACSPP